MLLCLCLGGCFSLGPSRLAEDQIGYSRALANSGRRQILLNIIRLRYGDAPVFLDTTQVISGYQRQSNVTGGFELFPGTRTSDYLTGTGSVQLQESPTFTFQPVTGENYAENFLRPLSPLTILPLIESGFPVDVLFRLAVQSIGTVRNSAGLERGAGQASPDFFVLLQQLRKLQIAGLISTRLGLSSRAGKDLKGNRQDHVYLTLSTSRDPLLASAIATVRRLLGLAGSSHIVEFEVVYGRYALGQKQIAILTRSMIGVLGQVGSQAKVPEMDVALGRTMPSIGYMIAETKPVVAIHSGPKEPRSPFVAVTFNGNWFWVDRNDFDSKVAFSVINVLLALAKTSSSPGAVITIPTR